MIRINYQQVIVHFHIVAMVSQYFTCQDVAGLIEKANACKVEEYKGWVEAIIWQIAKSMLQRQKISSEDCTRELNRYIWAKGAVSAPLSPFSPRSEEPRVSDVPSFFLAAVETASLVQTVRQMLSSPEILEEKIKEALFSLSETPCDDSEIGWQEMVDCLLTHLKEILDEDRFRDTFLSLCEFLCQQRGWLRLEKLFATWALTKEEFTALVVFSAEDEEAVEVLMTQFPNYLEQAAYENALCSLYSEKHREKIFSWIDEGWIGEGPIRELFEADLLIGNYSIIVEMARRGFIPKDLIESAFQSDPPFKELYEKWEL